MRSVQRLKYALASIVVLYALIAVGLRFLWPSGPTEVFPIFSWDLFSVVPGSVVVDYGVKITAVDGTALDPPLYFEQATAYFKQAHSVDASVIIGRLGTNCQGRNDPNLPIADYFNTVFLADHALVEYTVMQRTYDLLDRWHNQQFIAEQPVCIFKKQP